jgi:bifunctional non-homologous end joining protein LigD
VARPPTTGRGRDGLTAYDAKRDFGRTPEPAGATPRRRGGPGGRFVVQRHRARALHYDLRLEVDGVLASWAVPRGPTLDPRRRTLAVHVEDHPLEYSDFEGVIPSGEYGGGDVIVWDRGTWTPARTDDPAAAIAAGELHFDLDGEKLAGRFVLVRTGNDRRAREQWLLLHKNDEHARPGWDPEDHPVSVRSGRTNEQVRADPEALWHGDRPAAEAEEPIGRAGTGAEAVAAGARRWRVRNAELDRLDALGDAGRWQVRGRRLDLRGLDDVVLAARRGEPPVTVRDLVRYHAEVAPALRPHLAERPVAVARHPGGPPGGDGDLAAAAPRWMRRWRPRGAGAGAARLVLDEPAAVLWVAGAGGVELRPSAATTDAPDVPTWIVLEIRPGRRTAPDDVLLLGRLHRTAVDHLGLVGGVKTDGHGGLEVWLPVRARSTIAEATAWAGSLTRSIAASVPELVASGAAGRDGRARLVHRQGGHRRPVVPYGVVARRGAPVSCPLAWDELDDPTVLAAGTIRDVPGRLASVGDPFASLVGISQDLPPL